MDIDIADRIEAGLGTAPTPAPPLVDTLRAGRRAVRRRRLAVGAGGVAAALVIGGTALALAPGGDTTSGTDDLPVADRTTETSDPAPTAEPWGEGEPARLGTDGVTEINPDAKVVEQFTVTVADDARATAYRVTLDGTDYWVAAFPDPGGGAALATTPAGSQGLTLEEWTRLQLDPESGMADDTWVRFDSASHLVAVGRVQIVEQRPDPGFGDNFAGPGDPTAVAEVTLDGRTYFLAVRSIGGGPTEAIPYRADDRITTLDEFVDYAVQQYATNDEGGSEGMR